MKKGLRFSMITIVLLVLLVSASGCTVCKIIARGNKPMILNTLPEEYTVLGHFEKQKSFYFDYTATPDISSMLRESLAAYPESDAVVNVFITVKSTLGDFFMDLFTLTFANAYTLSVEGDIIKYKK